MGTICIYTKKDIGTQLLLTHKTTNKQGPTYIQTVSNEMMIHIKYLIDNKY